MSPKRISLILFYVTAFVAGCFGGYISQEKNGLWFNPGFTQITLPDCPASWVPRPGSSLCYFTDTGVQGMSYGQASTYCSSLQAGARLITIHDPETLAFIKSSLTVMLNAPAWVGAKAVVSFNNFEWSDGSKVSSELWDAQHASIADADDKDCAAVVPSWMLLGHQCAGPLHAICEYDRSKAAGATCPHGYLAMPGSNSCFKLYLTASMRGPARERCQQDANTTGVGHGHLAFIKTLHTWDFIKSKMSGTPASEAHIGAEDKTASPESSLILANLIWDDGQAMKSEYLADGIDVSAFTVDQPGSCVKLSGINQAMQLTRTEAPPDCGSSPYLCQFSLSHPTDFSENVALLSKGATCSFQNSSGRVEDHSLLLRGNPVMEPYADRNLQIMIQLATRYDLHAVLMEAKGLLFTSVSVVISTENTEVYRSEHQSSYFGENKVSPFVFPNSAEGSLVTITLTLTDDNHGFEIYRIQVVGTNKALISDRLTCDRLRELDYPSGDYELLINGRRFMAECDMSLPQKAKTIIHHNFESKRKYDVGACTGGNCEETLVYSNNIDAATHAKDLISISSSCQQDMQFDCPTVTGEMYVGSMADGLTGTGAGWVTVGGQKMSYWGAGPVTGGCTCVTDNSCSPVIYLSQSVKGTCNCMKEATALPANPDGGATTDSANLPVHKLQLKAGVFSVGPLVCEEPDVCLMEGAQRVVCGWAGITENECSNIGCCYGNNKCFRKDPGVIPRNCDEVRKQGKSSGYFLVDSRPWDAIPATRVHCLINDVTATAMVHNNLENNVEFTQKCGDNSPCNHVGVNYEKVSLEQLKQLVTDSGEECSQSLIFQCGPQTDDTPGLDQASWYNRDDVAKGIWNNVHGNPSTKCLAAEYGVWSDNNKCNCDKASVGWTEDSAEIWNSSDIPVRRLKFGRENRPIKVGVGPVKCPAVHCGLTHIGGLIKELDISDSVEGLVMLNYQFPGPSEIIAWDFYARKAGAFMLCVLRPPQSGNSYAIIGCNRMSDIQIGYNRFQVARNLTIQPQRHDVIGILTESTDDLIQVDGNFANDMYPNRWVTEVIKLSHATFGYDMVKAQGNLILDDALQRARMVVAVRAILKEVNWFLGGHKCYHSSPSTAPSHNEAEALCNGYGGHLVSIKNKAETTGLQHFMGYPSNGVFIGLKSSKNISKWMDDSSLLFSDFAKDDSLRRVVGLEYENITLRCDGERLIRVQYANFGRMSTRYTSYDSINMSPVCPNSQSLGIAQGLCNGQNECILQASKDVFGDPCPLTNKYLEVVYDCATQVGGDTCVAMGGATADVLLKWLTIPCDEERHYGFICEQAPERIYPLDCVSVVIGTKSDFACDRAPHSHLVSCTCPCHKFSIYGNTCNCECDTPGITVRCCDLTGKISGGRGSDQVMETALDCTTLKVGYTMSTSDALCPIDFPTMVSCTSNSDKMPLIVGNSRCDGETLNNAVCCRITAKKQEIFEKTLSKMAAPSVDTQVKSVEECERQCADDPLCMAYNSVSTCSFTLEGSEQNSVGVTLAECHTECNGDVACLNSLQFFFDCKGFYSNIVPMFEEGYKKREPYSQFSAFTVLPDLMFDPNIEATYSRALAGRSVGVADMNLCVHSCSETKGCEAVDHGEDDMCYHVQNTSQCCVLLTNKTYTQYNMDFKQHDSDIMSSWLLVHAKSRCTVREGSPASCMGDEMLVSCGCGTQSATPTISGSPASCECQPESSAKAICCKIINSPRNAPMACSPGMMVEDHVCTQCTGHTYTGNYHQTECLPCPEGAISTPFNSYCEYCPVGSVPNANKTACEKCEIGYNTNGPGDPYCTVINCQAPQNFANTTWNALSFTYGNIASYFCNPGFVVSNGTGFKICSCDGNWIGDEEFVCSELDECLSDACQNNATCTDAVDGYNCTCQAGYTGVHCETDIDECASDPCVDGTCYDFVNEHNCSCDPGFFGIICDMEINECSSNPCHFGGTCLDFVNYYICYCVNGTNGTHCENDIDECASCPCQNGGTCYDSLDSYNCSCAPGFEGANCQINIDECDSDPCQNNGSCLDLVNSYNCTCLETFNGTHCENELLCQDIRNISHLVVDLDYYPVYGFEGNVSCTQGRKLSSNVSSGIACLITQEWNNTIPPDACVLEDCPDVHSFTNMIATSVPYIHKYTHNTTVTCAEGFKLPTDFPEVITCTKTKEWSYNITNSTCINKECPDIRPFPHLLVDNDTFTTLYPYTGNISCEYPWELAPGISEQITCLLTELWDPDITTGVCVESNFCESNPCQHNGNCTRYFGGYNCTCEPGYFGTHCENATDECEPKPCLNGECFDLHLDYTCYCVNGYEGKDCQNLVNCSTPPPIVHADYVVGNTTYQSNVSYICHLGYEAVNATMLKTCHWNGTWVGDNFTCEDIDDCLNSTCPHNATCMDQVNNHTCICPVGYIGKFCHIALDYCLRYPCQNNGTCSNGLKGPGLFDCTCQQGWQGRLCQNGIDCFDPPYVSRARYLPHSATNLSSMVEYQCKTPYVKSNATTGIKTCMASGNWEGADIICEDPPIPTTTPRPPDAPTVPPTEPPIITIPVECPQPTIGPHTSVHAVLGDLQVGAIIRYECDFGYWISSSHTRQKILTCTDFHNNGVWVPYVELCVAVVCAAMPDPVGVMFPSWMLRFLTYEYTTMLTFSCEPGLAFPDTSKKRSAFCTADAVWSNQIPDCEKVSCPAHPPGLKVTSIKPGEDLLECPQEHTSFPSGLPFSMETCSSLGTWIPGNTRCFSSCSVPPEVDTMELRESVSTHIGAKLKLWCKPGFRLQFGHTYIEITCLDNHKWYPEDIEPCAEKRCPQVPGIGNATSSSQAVFVDTTVEYTCDTGYYFNLTKTSTYSVYCQPNETWSWYPETCIEIHCGEPPSGVSGNMIQNYTTDTYGSLATYTCLENHRFTDGSEVMSLPCQENGTWQAMTDTCQLGRCPPQPDVQGALPDRMEATVGTKVTYTCEEGYTFPTQSPTETIECHQNLSWTKIQEGCTRVLCPEIDEVPNLEVSGKAYGHAYGESRNVSCGVGYRLKNHDSATITCLANGQWSQTIDNSTCIPVECPELRSVQYAYAQGITGHKYGDTATYFCYLEFEFPNKEWFRQIHCTANGTWSARVEMGCIVVSCGRLLSPAITLNTTRHTVNTAMTSTCPEGYLFADGLATHISKCHANGSWYPQVDIVCHIAHKVRQILFEVEEAPVSASIGILSCGLVLVTVFLVVGTDVFGCVVSIMAKKQAASLMQQTTGAKIKEIAP